MDKKKILTYCISIIVPMVCLAAGLVFGAKPGIEYIVAYEVLMLEVCFLTVGVIWHGVKKDMALKIVASKVWFAFLILATIMIILTESWGIVTLMVGVGILGLINWAGFRFIVKDDSGFISSIKEDKVEKLARTMVYKIGEDGNPNEEEPICIVEGVAVTPARALEKGYVDVAKAGIEYIRTIV